ncbi:hypothetical protein [Sulfurimonas sp.]
MTFYKKHYKKIIIFGLLKKLVLVLFFMGVFSHAEGTYSGIYFTDYEENATLYFCNYYNYIDINDVVRNSNAANNIVNGRVDGLYSSISDIDSLGYVTANRLHRLKQESHLIDWNIYTDDFGMTLQQTNFIYALVGSLIGFTFLFFFIYILISRGL